VRAQNFNNTLTAPYRCANITIHGLGASIEKSIQLALKLQVELNDQVELKCTTGTVELVDDIIPEDMVSDICMFD
jgi:type III secretion system FlhB-like substrate exporter